MAADRDRRDVWALKRAAAEEDVEIVVPAPILAQVWRGAASASLARFLRGVPVLPLDERLARRTGELLGRSGTHDVCDAALAASAEDGDRILTGDTGDIARLVELRGVRAWVLPV